MPVQLPPGEDGGSPRWGAYHTEGAATGSASDSAGSHCREKFYWVDATFSETVWALVTWCRHFPKKPVLEGGGARPVAPRVSGVKKEEKSVLVVPEQVRVCWEGSGLTYPPWFNQSPGSHGLPQSELVRSDQIRTDTEQGVKNKS